MNNKLKNKTKEILKKHEVPYFDYSIKKLLIETNICEKLSVFGSFCDLDDEERKGSLFSIFLEIFYVDCYKKNQYYYNEGFCEVISYKDMYKKENIDTEILKVIYLFLHDNPLHESYNQIIKICNTISYKYYNVYYENFLLKYIEEIYD